MLLTCKLALIDVKSNIPLGSSVAVIGAGIVGIQVPVLLNQKGYHVSVYDPSDPGEGGASKANAGHIGASDIFPLEYSRNTLEGIKNVNGF